MSTQRRTLGVHSRPRPLGPNGERICYNCAGPLPKPKRYNCSRKCSEEWVAKTSPSIMRRRIYTRDHGICCLCGLDTSALKVQYEQLSDTDAKRRFRELHGIPLSRTHCRWWFDADHIVPVIEGGGECGLENYRTLCFGCHKRVTAELRARIAERRRLQQNPAGSASDLVVNREGR